MRKTLNIYIFKEILTPFLLGITIFTFILIMDRILKLTELVVNKGVSMYDVLSLLLFIMPSFFVLAIPMAFLFAILLAFGRLSTDNEITALKASGIGIFQFISPVLIFSIITYIITSFMMLYALPRGNQSFRGLIFKIIKTKANIGIKERVFNDDFEGLVLYVNKASPSGEVIEGIMISDERDRGNGSNTIFANRGYIISDPNKLTTTLRLMDGSIHQTAKNLVVYKIMNFKRYDITLDISDVLSDNKSNNKENIPKGDREMTIKELKTQIKKLKIEKGNYYPKLVELHKKFSLPFSCIVFAFIGLPLGIQTRRGGKVVGFVISLVIIMFYYILITSGEALGDKGIISPFLGMWLPNIILGILGMYLCAKTVKESPIKPILWFGRLIEVIRQRLKRIEHNI